MLYELKSKLIQNVTSKVDKFVFLKISYVNHPQYWSSVFLEVFISTKKKKKHQGIPFVLVLEKKTTSSQIHKKCFRFNN